MRKTYQLLSLGFAAVILAACGSSRGEELSLEDDFQEVEINGQYKMHVPDYMNQSYDLNAEASLQYQNTTKETYVIIIDEDKEEFVEMFQLIGMYDDELSVIDNYASVQTQSLLENVTVEEKTEPKSYEINGLPAVTTEIQGEATGVVYPIYYYMTFIEGADDLYMIMTWTLKESKDTYKGTFEKMVKSFEEK